MCERVRSINLVRDCVSNIIRFGTESETVATMYDCVKPLLLTWYSGQVSSVALTTNKYAALFRHMHKPTGYCGCGDDDDADSGSFVTWKHVHE